MNESILKQWAAEGMSSKRYLSNIFPPSIYYRFFRVAAKNIQPKLSVELGVDGGGGCLYLSLGWPKGVVIGIDNQDNHRSRIDYIEEKCSNFVFFIDDSVTKAKWIYDTYGEVDILFIDTIHTYERTMLEYKTWLPFMSDKGIICFDDLLRPGMSQLWSDLPNPKTENGLFTRRRGEWRRLWSDLE